MSAHTTNTTNSATETRVAREKLTYLHQSRNRFQPGFVYRHSWETGYQDLVFASHKAAARFASDARDIESPLDLPDLARVICGLPKLPAKCQQHPQCGKGQGHDGPCVRFTRKGIVVLEGSAK